MGNIADDIPRLRDAGKSDEDILAGVKSYAPQYSEDIDKLMKAGKSPADIVSGLQSYDAQQNPHDTSYTSALHKGVTDLAGGLGKTLDMEGVSSGLGGSAKQALQSVGNAGPSDYQPANPQLLHPSTWSQIPRALAENAPALATDIAAGGVGSSVGAGIGGAAGLLGGPAAEVTVPALATLGGMAGMGLSHWLHSGGNDAQEHADTRTGTTNAPISDADKNAALLNATAQGVLGRIGIKGIPGIADGAVGSAIKASEGSVGPQLVKQMATGAATDAATSAAGDAAKQLAINDKTFGTLDPNSIGNSALVGAGAGLGVRAVSSVSDLSAANKFKTLDPEAVRPVADMLHEAAGPKGVGDSPHGDFNAIKEVERNLSTKIGNSEATKNVKAHIDSLGETDPGNNVAETLQRVKQTIADGDRAKPEDLQYLSDKLGGNDQAPHSQDLVDTLGHLDTLNAIKAKGNVDTAKGTFMGGMAGTPFADNYLRPMSKGGIQADVFSSVAGPFAHAMVPAALHSLSAATASPWLMAAEPAARTAAYGLMRGYDALTGSRSPLKQFTNRFSSSSDGAPVSSTDPNAPNPPSFLQHQKAQELLDKANQAAAASKAGASAVGDAVKSAVSDANAKTKAAAAEAKAKADAFNQALSNARQTSRLMTNSDPAKTSSSDATLPIQVAKLKADYAAQAEDAKSAQAKETIKGLVQAQKAALSAHKATQSPKVRQATPVVSTAPKPVSEAPTASNGQHSATAEAYPADKYHKITVGSQTVYRSKEGIKNDARYIAATKTNMYIREGAVNEAKAAVPATFRPHLNGILTWLNHQPQSWAEAYSHIEDLVNKLPEAHQAQVMGALSKVQGTYKEQ